MNGYNFTERVRKMLAGARSEASRLQHEYVGTEHILLALTDSDGKGRAALVNLGVPLDRVRKKIEETVKTGRGAATGPDLPYTSRAKKVLELSMGEARDFSHAYVGTEHVLLGLIREEKGIAAQVLNEVGVTLTDATNEVLRLLDRSTNGEPGAAPAMRPRRPFASIRPSERVSAILESAQALATEMQRENIAPEQIAIALLRDGGGSANAALDRLGINHEETIAKLDTIARRDAAARAPDTAWVNQLRRPMRTGPRDVVETDELFLAILDTSVPVAQTFAERGITAAAVRVEIERMKG